MERETTIAGVASDSIQLQAAPRRAGETSLQGSVLVLIQFDVAEEIRLDELRKIFGARTAEASFKHPAPGYVQYQRPESRTRVSHSPENGSSSTTLSTP